MGGERKIHPLGSLLKWPQYLGLYQGEARNQDFHLGVPHGCRAPRTWATFSAFTDPVAGAESKVDEPGLDSVLMRYASVEVLVEPTVPQCWPITYVLFSSDSFLTETLTHNNI